MSDRRPVRIGIIGAATIAADAMVRPVSRRSDAEIVAVAARRPGAAESFAVEHGIETAVEHYDAVIEDDRVDLVYIALAASDHARWAIAALDVGKHVLVEKPAATSATDAARMVAAAGPGRLVEAFHYRHHPLFAEVLALVRSGRLGSLLSMTSEIRDTRPFDPRSILHDPAAGGGVLLHAGCYAVHWMRTLAGSEPRVLDARARRNPLGGDETIETRLLFPGDVEGRLYASFGPEERQGNGLLIEGSLGTLRVDNLIAPHLGHSVTLALRGEPTRTFTVAGRTSYDHQLGALLDSLAAGSPAATDGADIVGNASAIDSIADAAGRGAETT
ncbi:Gfo/Idh/MocA family oxidoreductase [Labedella phragmitis]|uniref:Gfo/Idh/MocA family oxidoreductase n=1 Tax=Labedella phragmitis TaxID=2498849 RepID=A0A3S3ZB24_9MICO|nr:Gfo/Idh/MocA family oxidoreductase [Labedella phragmitis]RWZ52827.1 Gfo/Idh/MocA family oxidoreductase [Labedella phragmitis]